jgi:hypothetical protein
MSVTHHRLVLVSCMLWAAAMGGRALAQEDNVGTAVSALQDVLSTLQQSVKRLSADNDQLAARNQSVKDQLSRLQMQLGGLKSQADELNGTAGRLREKNPQRSRQIARLEEEDLDLDDRIQKAQSAVKLTGGSLDTEGGEDQDRFFRSATAVPAQQLPPGPGSSDSGESLSLQKEKLHLMKMIYDSQQRQESMQESILEFQKQAPPSPLAGALMHQQFLKEQVRRMQAGLPKPAAGGGLAVSDRWDDIHLSRLEAELKALEENYSQLKDLMKQINNKTQSVPLTVSQRTEGERLQGSINELNRQGEGLRADLDELRTQMIDLDKRKSRLEGMIRP